MASSLLVPLNPLTTKIAPTSLPPASGTLPSLVPMTGLISLALSSIDSTSLDTPSTQLSLTSTIITSSASTLSPELSTETDTPALGTPSDHTHQVVSTPLSVSSTSPSSAVKPPSVPSSPPSSISSSSTTTVISTVSAEPSRSVPSNNLTPTGIPVPAPSQSISPVSSSLVRTLPIGLILGSVIGAILLLVLLGLVVYWYYRRRNARPLVSQFQTFRDEHSAEPAFFDKHALASSAHGTHRYTESSVSNSSSLRIRPGGPRPRPQPRPSFIDIVRDDGSVHSLGARTVTPTPPNTSMTRDITEAHPLMAQQGEPRSIQWRHHEDSGVRLEDPEAMIVDVPPPYSRR